ncbi:hypothetical protein ACJX0J_029156, partial [Zea mays]
KIWIIRLRYLNLNNKGQMEEVNYLQDSLSGNIENASNEIEHNKSMQESMQAPLNLKTLVFGLVH